MSSPSDGDNFSVGPVGSGVGGVRAGRDVHIHQDGANAAQTTPRLGIRPSIRDFSGRKTELAELQAKLEAGVTILGIRGLGGVGKSELALKLIEQVAGEYPGGAIRVDMRGNSPGPDLTPAEAMQQVILAFLPNEKLPEDENVLERTYQHILANKRGILLLDDATERPQVEQLIPPSTWTLVVTSRVHFPIPGMQPLNLKSMPTDESVELLRQIAPGLEVETAKGIADRLGGLPLALRLAGSLLASETWFSPKEWLVEFDRWTDVEELNELAVTLRMSLKRLSAIERTQWALLAVFPASFGKGAVAAIWNMYNKRQAVQMVGKLLRLSLVQKVGKRVELHDLLRDLALEMLTPTKLEKTRRCHAEYFCRVLRKCDEQFLAGGGEVVKGLTHFDVDRLNIEAGHVWARGQQSTRFGSRLLVEYADAGSYVLDLRQHSNERRVWLELASSAAQRLGDLRARARQLGGLGNMYDLLGKFQKAIDYYSQAVAISRKIGSQSEVARNLGNLGCAYVSLGEVQKAVDHFNQALAFSRETGNRRGMIAGLGNLGNAYSCLGEPQKAIDHYRESLKIAREIGDRQSENNTLGHLGRVNALLGEPRKAIDLLSQSLDIARDIGDRYCEGHHLGTLSDIHADLGEMQEAIDIGEQALAIARDIGNRLVESIRLGNLGKAYADLGDPEKGIDLIEQALTIARDIGYRQGESHHLGNLSEVFARFGGTSETMAPLDKALIITREIGYRQGESKHLGNLGKVRADLGEHKVAIDLFNQALTITREIAYRKGESNHLGNLGQVHAAVGEPKMAIDFLSQALTIAREIGYRPGETKHLDNLNKVRTALGQPEETTD